MLVNLLYTIMSTLEYIFYKYLKKEKINNKHVK